MARGVLSMGSLRDIANAIREQNGTSTLYRPGEMAAAVLALDGSKAGTGAQYALSSQAGALDPQVLTDIADAIRSQNGLSTKYKPGEMGDAIRALTWDTGLKARALLLSDGTLELNYREGRSSDVAGASIVRAFEVDTAGYSISTARPWNDVQGDVLKVVIDADFAGAGLADASYLFSGFSSMTEVRGFENLQGITKAVQIFSGCEALESVFATSFDSSSLSSASMAFYGCGRLVGPTGFVPESTTGASAFQIGSMGVLTDPSADAREWVWANLYADGELVVRSEEGADSSRVLVAGGRMCCRALYRGGGAQPWRGARAQLKKVTFALDQSYEKLNLQYWFYSCTALAEVAGMATLSGLYRLDYVFSGCSALTEVDLRGVDGSTIYSLYYAFAGCRALATVYLDEGWKCSASNGGGCFYNCTSIVGGNGTAYDSTRITGTYLRPDTAASPGYGTVA